MPVMTKTEEVTMCTHWDTIDIHMNGAYVGTYCMDCNTEFYKRTHDRIMEEKDASGEPRGDALSERDVEGPIPRRG
jgi:hypothetical protein